MSEKNEIKILTFPDQPIEKIPAITIYDSYRWMYHFLVFPKMGKIKGIIFFEPIFRKILEDLLGIEILLSEEDLYYEFLPKNEIQEEDLFSLLSEKFNIAETKNQKQELNQI